MRGGGGGECPVDQWQNHSAADVTFFSFLQLNEVLHRVTQSHHETVLTHFDIKKNDTNSHFEARCTKREKMLLLIGEIIPLGTELFFIPNHSWYLLKSWCSVGVS